MKNNILLFLTACVNPRGMAFTKIQDKEVRLNQYINSINYYLKKTKYKILVVENTNEDLSKYVVAPTDRIEFLTFDGNNYDKKLGKGYGEALIIEYATKHSIFYKSADYVVKITGRNIILNINSLIKEIKDFSFVYANIKGLNGRLTCESRIVGFPKIFLEKSFLPCKESLDDSKGYYFEDLLFDTSKYHLKEFFHPILIKGVSGSTGENLYPTISTYFKGPLNYILHKLRLYKVNI